MQTDCFPDTPADWPKGPVSGLARVNPRYPVAKDREYAFVEMAAVGENFGGILSFGKRGLEGSGLTRFRVGDTLFAKITPCPENGKVAFVESLPGEVGLGSTEFLVLSPKGQTHPRFLFHLLCSHDVRGRAAARMEGSTGRQRIPEEVFEKRLVVPLPPPEEQAAIARVLDAVDNAIEKTRAAVERAKEVKRALSQECFEFRNATGALTDSGTELGRLPAGWEAVRGKQAFRILTGGCSSVDAVKPVPFGKDPDAWFMKVDDFNLPENRRAIVRTKIGFERAANPFFRLLPIGTVIIAKRGAAISKNRVRTTAVPVALDPNLMAIEPLGGLSGEFLRLQLEWRNVSRYVESSGVPQLNNKDLYPRWFLRAPAKAQEDVVALLRAAEKCEDALLAKSGTLLELKRALAHDLLTGAVRVHPRLFEEALQR